MVMLPACAHGNSPAETTPTTSPCGPPWRAATRLDLCAACSAHNMRLHACYAWHIFEHLWSHLPAPYLRDALLAGVRERLTPLAVVAAVCVAHGRAEELGPGIMPCLCGYVQCLRHTWVTSHVRDLTDKSISLKLHLLTRGYTWLHVATLGYTWLHLATLGYTWIHLVTLGYTVVTLTSHVM